MGMAVGPGNVGRPGGNLRSVGKEHEKPVEGPPVCKNNSHGASSVGLPEPGGTQSVSGSVTPPSRSTPGDVRGKVEEMRERFNKVLKSLEGIKPDENTEVGNNGQKDPSIGHGSNTQLEYFDANKTVTMDQARKNWNRLKAERRHDGA